MNPTPPGRVSTSESAGELERNQQPARGPGSQAVRSSVTTPNGLNTLVANRLSQRANTRFFPNESAVAFSDHWTSTPDLHERALHCCEVCGGRGATNAHHRVNAGQGGRATRGNLLLVCGSGTTGCHGRITANPAWARAQSYTVGGTFEPCDVPVVRWSRWTGSPQVVLLDDRGGIAPTDRTPGM